MSVKDLVDFGSLDGTYFVKSKTVATTKNNKDYYNLELQDKTGSIVAKVWDICSPDIQNFDQGDFVHVKGKVSTYMGTLQGNVSSVTLATEGSYDIADFMPVSPFDINTMYNDVVGYIATVRNEYLNGLLKEFYVNYQGMVDLIKSHSAASGVHHAFVGGFLQHTLAVTELCNSYCELYPTLNRDLLITVALLHDIGKLRELTAFPENDYSDEGKLLGHIILGIEWIGNCIRGIQDFPPDLALDVKHCIASHHGELEWGSPKKPAIPEAMALHMADLTDSRLEQFIECIGTEGSDGSWTSFNRRLGTPIRLSRLSSKSEDL